MVQRLTATARLDHSRFSAYCDFSYLRDAEDKRTKSTDIGRLIMGLSSALKPSEWANPDAVLVRVDSYAESDDGFWSLADLRRELARRSLPHTAYPARIAGNLLYYDGEDKAKPRQRLRQRPTREAMAQSSPERRTRPSERVIQRTLAATGPLQGRTTSIKIPQGSLPTTAVIHFSNVPPSSSSVLEVVGTDGSMREISMPQGKMLTRIVDLKPGVRYAFYLKGGKNEELRAELSVAVREGRNV